MMVTVVCLCVCVCTCDKFKAAAQVSVVVTAASDRALYTVFTFHCRNANALAGGTSLGAHTHSERAPPVSGRARALQAVCVQTHSLFTR